MFKVKREFSLSKPEGFGSMIFMPGSSFIVISVTEPEKKNWLNDDLCVIHGLPNGMPGRQGLFHCLVEDDSDFARKPHLYIEGMM